MRHADWFHRRNKSTGRSARDCYHAPLPFAAERRGAVAVEFALAAGILFLVLFVSVEFMRVNTIVNTAQNAAYEGARAAITPGTSVSAAKNAADSILRVIRVRQSTVTVDPSPIQEDTRELTVTVSVPLDKNSFIVPRFFLGRTLTRSCTLSREVCATTGS